VTVVVRWTPGLSVRCGTRVARWGVRRWLVYGGSGSSSRDGEARPGWPPPHWQGPGGLAAARLLVLQSPDNPHRLGSMARVDDPYHYLDRAFEYYVTGRFAALNNLKVAPNLFHHAVEMLAKFQLLRRVPDDRLAEQLKKLKLKPYGHNLHTLWSAFKAAVGRSSLDRFDAVVADLNRWEDLRYGGFPVGIPTTMVFMMRRGPRETWSAEPQDEYVVVLEDIDELFTAMVTAARINPTFVGERHRLKPAMREWYAKDNVHSMADVFRIDPPAET
jgi:hypothetical protein